MVAIFQALFHKKEEKGAMQLLGNIQDYLTREFHLQSGDLAYLRYVGRKEVFGGDQSNFVRIFNVEKVNETGVVVDNFDDLDNHPELVLFEGHVFKAKMSLVRKEQKKKAIASVMA